MLNSTNIVTRRKILKTGGAAVAASGLAAAATVAGCRLAQAATHNPDAELFRAWTELVSAWDHWQDSPDPQEALKRAGLPACRAAEAEANRRQNRFYDIYNALTDLPAMTVSGCALKLRAALYPITREYWDDEGDERLLFSGAPLPPDYGSNFECYTPDEETATRMLINTIVSLERLAAEPLEQEPAAIETRHARAQRTIA